MSTRGSPSQPERSEAEYATASEEGLGSNSNVDPLQPQEDVSIPMEPRGLFFKQSEYLLYPKLQSRCETFNFMEVFKRLDISERNWFENHPQFKHIVHMFIQKNRMLMGMWMLLLRTAVTDKKRQCWFVVNVRDFVEEQFGKTNIEVKEVREKLESMDFIEGGTDRLKMVVLFFLATVIKGKSKKYGGSIDPFILRVVDDLDLCETFLWGRFIFDDVLAEVAHLVDHFGGSVRGNWTFPGFILPLEILAFESIPVLKEAFQEKVWNADGDCPRMCKWKFKRTCKTGFSLADIYEVLGDTKDIISILVPEDGEAKLLLDILDEHVWDDFEVGEDDAVSDPVVDSWHTILVQQKKKIHLKDLYQLDVKSREDQPLPKPTDTEAVGSEDVLKKMEEGFIKINEKMEEGFRKINEKVHEMDTRLKSVEMKIADQRRDSDFMDFQYEDVGRVYETGGGSNARGDKGMEETTNTPVEETTDAPAEETRDAPAEETRDAPAEETRDAPAPVPAEETTDAPAPALETTNAPTPVVETPEPPPKKPRYKICMRKSAESKGRLRSLGVGERVQLIFLVSTTDIIAYN
ncbi:uncharacterized protein At3g43530-like [Eutrema salsugineum]|uniref:uncharacterized protein At3g43530-like n=1 Tax=Eutrema salsugineum TaxID=72664 RepID=UPI000CED108C|nr:uncharacterized protein At3g43530-like [Eutrema salsugineum]